MPAARHHLCRAAQGNAAPRRLGRRRGHGLAFDPRYQGARRLHGRHAPDDGQGHVRHQRHRARHRLADASQPRRLLRPRQGQDALVGQVSVRRSGNPVSRLLARLRVRCQGPGARPHRPPPQAAGDDVLDGTRQRRDGEAAHRTRRRGPGARPVRGDRHDERGNPRPLFMPRRSVRSSRAPGSRPSMRSACVGRSSPSTWSTPRPATSSPRPAPR